MVEKRKSAVNHYTGLLTAENRNQKEDVPILTHPPEILQMKVGTVKRLVEERNIPHYKREHNVYFFEDELIKWIEESKVKMSSSYTYYRR